MDEGGGLGLLSKQGPALDCLGVPGGGGGGLEGEGIILSASAADLAGFVAAPLAARCGERDVLA